jgi:hypothetical protein
MKIMSVSLQQDEDYVSDSLQQDEDYVSDCLQPDEDYVSDCLQQDEDYVSDCLQQDEGYVSDCLQQDEDYVRYFNKMKVMSDTFPHCIEYQSFIHLFLHFDNYFNASQLLDLIGSFTINDRV